MVDLVWVAHGLCMLDLASELGIFLDVFDAWKHRNDVGSCWIELVALEGWAKSDFGFSGKDAARHHFDAARHHHSWGRTASMAESQGSFPLAFSLGFWVPIVMYLLYKLCRDVISSSK